MMGFVWRLLGQSRLISESRALELARHHEQEAAQTWQEPASVHWTRRGYVVKSPSNARGGYLLIEIDGTTGDSTSRRVMPR
jgi:hypothetical protein